ncbi:MAG: DUF4215 domain-containing protein, partial [Pseudomonadota bacterium]
MDKSRTTAVALTLLTFGLLAGSPTYAQALCGNGEPDPGEECDDGNTADGDGCSSACLIESTGGSGFDCSPPIAGTPPVNLVTDGSFEDLNAGGDWAILDHSLFGPAILHEGNFSSPPASDPDGNLISGATFLISGGSFTSASTGVAEHTPIVIPPDGTVLSFNYLVASGLPEGCAGQDDGLRLLIDGVEVWASLDYTPEGQCVQFFPYEVVNIDLAALGLNDAQAHTLRFEGASSVIIGPDPGTGDDELTNIFLDQVRIIVEAPDAQPPVPSVCTPVICGDGLFPQFSARGTEQCDDGNMVDGDGCSSTCTVEHLDFVCIDPVAPADEANMIVDGGLEDGLSSNAWDVRRVDGVTTRTQTICSQATCGASLGDVNEDGLPSAWYAWFGNSSQPNYQRMTQRVVIPVTATTLDFNVLVGACDSTDDTLRVLVDFTEVYRLNCVDDFPVYTPQTADVSAFANGFTHSVQFEGSTVATNGGGSNIFVDNIRLGDNLPFAGEPGVCDALAQACTTPEQFTSNIPTEWTVINAGPEPLDGWRLSNDALCAAFNWSGGNEQSNVTGGAGAAACANSDATGQIAVDSGNAPLQMDTYLCTDALDFAAVTAPVLSLRVNYQAADNALNDNGTPSDPDDDFDDDLFEVLVGTVPPTAESLASYSQIANVQDHLDLNLVDSPAQ